MPDFKEVTALEGFEGRMLEAVTVKDFGAGKKMMYNDKPIDAYITIGKDGEFFLATFMQWSAHTKDYAMVFTAPAYHPIADEAFRDAASWAIFENLLVLI